MPLQPFQLQAALDAIGDGELFIGNPFQVDGLGMASLGMFEGELRLEGGWNVNALTTERTGGAIHQATVTPGDIAIVGSIVIGDSDMWAKVSPTGTTGIGHSAPQPVVEQSVLLIPRRELPISYAGGPPKVWTPAAPENAVWLWRAFIARGNIPFRLAEGGKAVTDIRITPMWYGGANVPDGQKLLTIGDPVAQGVLNLAIG